MANPPAPSGKRQKRMGPAPFASFEDLSDEVRAGRGVLLQTEVSPSDGHATRLPGIHEDVTPVTPARDLPAMTTSTTLTPSAPRIDISRASSSSQHEDSRDSTPERELFQGGNGQCKLGLAFKEEGALELRSSTEELDFQDPSDPRNQQPRTSVTVASASTGCELPTHQRKDSQGSEYGGLLSISGRTSRLSSIGSQGSRVSGQSRLSVTSEMSRSPSPHKMLLETSFCGSKTGAGQSTGTTCPPGSNKHVETELLEKVLLSRKHDPTEAILAEGISIECRRKLKPADSMVQLSPVLQHVNMQQQQQEEAAKSPEVARSPVPPEKPIRKSLTPKVPAAPAPTPAPAPPCAPVITVDKPSEDEVIENDSRCTKLKAGEQVVTESGTEYTFIPLKGPLPKAASKSASPRTTKTRTPSSSVSPKAKGDPQYIRIKLKPDHMYPPEDRTGDPCAKPVTLDLRDNSVAHATTSVDFIGRDMLNGGSGAHGRSPRSPVLNSTPSPSVSRKSSFASLFRGKDYGTSPESPTIPAAKGRKASARSRSKSSERSDAADKAGKHKSVFTLFKSKKAHSKSKQSLHADTSPCRQPATSLHSLEFTFDQAPAPLPTAPKRRYEIPLDADTIIIPLHSPGNEPPPLPLYADTPEEEKLPPARPTRTVVDEFVSNSEQLEIHQRSAESVTATTAPAAASATTTTTTTAEVNVKKHRQSTTSNRQSSTSSENVVFTTNLGSDNEIFTTKLPKKPEQEKAKERGRCRERSAPAPISAPSALELTVSQAAMPATVTTVTTSVTRSASRTSLTSPVQTRSGLSSPCTSVNAKITEIITEKGMTSARVSKSTSPVARKAEKLIISNGRARHAGSDKDLSAAEPDADTSERATAGGDSSESEPDFPAAKPELVKRPKKVEPDESENEAERKGLVLQTDSFDDELPYVPTTLPQERSVAVPIVPVKQRATFEIKTWPTERPRSTTPINPSCLEEYVEDTAERASLSEKLRICLPREDSIPGPVGAAESTRVKDREKGAKKWTDFVPQPPPGGGKHHAPHDEEVAPPLPPRGFPKDWINFEDIPERRKPPKRIQTIPSRGNLLPPAASTAAAPVTDEANVIYSYVNPEDCKCECHESGGTPKTPGGTKLPPSCSTATAAATGHEEDEQPLLLERRSDSSPDSQTGAPPLLKKKSKPTNAFPKVATTKAS